MIRYRPLPGSNQAEIADVMRRSGWYFLRNVLLARPERFELPTPWFEARYSIQLSYGRNDQNSTIFYPGRQEPGGLSGFSGIGGSIRCITFTL